MPRIKIRFHKNSSFNEFIVDYQLPPYGLNVLLADASQLPDKLQFGAASLGTQVRKYRLESQPEQPVELHHDALCIVLAVNHGKLNATFRGTEDRDVHLNGAAVAAVGTADFCARVAGDGKLTERQDPAAPADAEYGFSDDEGVTLHLQTAFAEEGEQAGQEKGQQPDDSLNRPEQKEECIFLLVDAQA